MELFCQRIQRLVLKVMTKAFLVKVVEKLEVQKKKNPLNQSQ
jgi:hypothetical protein